MLYQYKNHLHPNNEKEFFKKVKLYENYTYSFYHYLFSTVKKLAIENGVTIKYNPPGTAEYRELGDASFKVIGIGISITEQKPQIFDPKNLVNEVNQEWRSIET